MLECIDTILLFIIMLELAELGAILMRKEKK